MSIKSDHWIRRMAQQHGMIEPYEPGQVRHREGVGRLISYGTSSYGYDIRCADEFKIFTNINSAVVDPKNFDANSFVDVKSDVCIIPPNSFALARTVEYFRIPRSVLTICLGKSTYARCGIIVNVTPLEPEWEGHVTLEFPGAQNNRGSDHASFVCHGVPAFRLQSSYEEYRQYTWHTNRDTYDKIVFDDLKENATLAAMLAYAASEDPERVPATRAVLPPNPGSDRPRPWMQCGTARRSPM